MMKNNWRNFAFAVSFFTVMTGSAFCLAADNTAADFMSEGPDTIVTNTAAYKGDNSVLDPENMMSEGITQNPPQTKHNLIAYDSSCPDMQELLNEGICLNKI